MPKLHYCSNGTSVTDQVLTYLNTRANSDYIPIQQYYDNYKSHWYKQLEDYMDRPTFDAEFDYRLCQAVIKFHTSTAKRLAKKNKWSTIGMFNRWFYRCLIHWGLNVKTSAYRLKKRPAVQCPVCGRMLSKIDAEHLLHIKPAKELPLVFEYNGLIYETVIIPTKYAVCWGSNSQEKLDNLLEGRFRLYNKDRKQVRWPWKLSDSSKGVVCPFTHKIVPKIDSDYLKSLDDKYSRYATPMTWSEFVEKHPMVLIQAEIYSLDYNDNRSDDVLLKDVLSSKIVVDEMDHKAIKSGKILPRYEHTFKVIDEIVRDRYSRDVLKLTAIGYSVDDIADTLKIEKKIVKKSLFAMRNFPQIKAKLLDV